MKKIDELTKRLKMIGDRIYRHGEEAARKGFNINDNPWKETLHEYYIWKSGYINEISTRNKNG